MHASRLWISILLVAAGAAATGAQEAPLRESWDYVAAMKKVAAGFRGRPGVVLHVGDSITYSNPYGQWARSGQGQTEADKSVLRWMHCGADDNNDGWWLARFDHPAGGRSHTACSGIRADEMLAGGKRNMPSLSAMLENYRPQIVVLMLGTNDASAGRPLAAYQADMRKAIDLVLGHDSICILSTIPPHYGRRELAESYNAALREIAKARGLPLIDYEKEILHRRRGDFNGTLLGHNNVHPTASAGGATPSSAPTPENLRNSGYLLRGWLSVRKIGEVKRAVLDGVALPPAPRPADASSPRPAAPVGEPIRVPIVRDTWFSAVGDEADCNLGGAAKLKVKSIQEMSLLDFDPAPLRGRVINGATLHMHPQGSEIVRRVTVGSFGSPWLEGTSPRYAPQAGSSTFNHRRHPDVAWAFPGSDLVSVMLGQGGTIWRMADATSPNGRGWQHVPVDPQVVAARVAGISHGLLVFDDVGSEWTRRGEQFTPRHMPNRFFHSRESGEATAPYLTVLLGAEDTQPPAAPTALAIGTGDLPAGNADLSWTTPADAGPAGTIGFLVTVGNKPVPRYQIPPAGSPGETISMRLTDMPAAWRAGMPVTIAAVDAAGNVSQGVSVPLAISSRRPKPLPGRPPAPFTAGGSLPKLGGAEVAIIDALDKVDPRTGEMTPKQAAGYRTANHLFSAEKPQIRLAAAKGETVAFQIDFGGTVRGVRSALVFDDERAKAKVRFARYGYVMSKRGPLPDPIVPLARPFDLPDTGAAIAGQTHGSLLCEIHVPHDAAIGPHRAKLTLRTADASLRIDTSLWVWDFHLPDFLSFLPEMNAYDLPENERDYYRLAHRHRTVLNRLPYHQSGNVSDGCAPQWDGQKFDWTAWDRRFAQYFDGSAFADLPRRGVPIEGFYLPLHENWPSTMDANYNGDYWADRAFPPSYRQTFVDASRQMAEHFRDKGWNQTIFQCYQNNKNNFKKNGWSRGSSPWLLDEPANFQDYWALRYFAEAFHEGVRGATGAAEKIKLCYRGDISRPQWQRDALDHVLDYNVVGGRALDKYHRLVMRRKEKFGHIVVPYGTTNAIEASNMQPVGWCLDSWTRGGDGVVPWQTIGRDNSWKQADTLSLFYPGQAIGRDEPVPSIRLKAYRRGQQDVEYLVLLSRAMGEPRWATGQAVRRVLNLVGQQQGTGFTGGEDAGTTHYADLLPQDAWSLRVRVAQAVASLHPKPQRQLVDLRTPPRNPADAPPAYAVGHADAGATPAPAQTPSSPPATVVTLQGRAVVRDALIDPEQPEKSFGAVPRDNRLARRDACSALLVRFDLGGVKLPAGAAVRKATVSFYVWDPSSKGSTKVCALGMKTPWDEATVAWRRPSTGAKWKGGDGFALATDTGPLIDHVVVPPDRGRDTVDPPIEYRLDVTGLARQWISGKVPNYGVAIAPVIDRSIDDGQYTRLQVLASEYSRPQQTPMLTIELQ